MAEVYGNVNVNYSYCKSVAQLKVRQIIFLERKKNRLKKESRRQDRICTERLDVTGIILLTVC